MAKIAVFGCGAWASVVANLFAANQHSVAVLCHRSEYLDVFENKRKHFMIPSISFNDRVKAFLKLEGCYKGR